MEVFKLNGSSYDGYSKPGFYFWDLKFEYVVGPFKKKKDASLHLSELLEKAYGSKECGVCKRLEELMNEAYEEEVNTYQHLKFNGKDLFAYKSKGRRKEVYCIVCGKLFGSFTE